GYGLRCRLDGSLVTPCHGHRLRWRCGIEVAVVVHLHFFLLPGGGRWRVLERYSAVLVHPLVHFRPGKRAGRQQNYDGKHYPYGHLLLLPKYYCYVDNCQIDPAFNVQLSSAPTSADQLRVMLRVSPRRRVTP